jgi:hypothetical protein
LRHGASKQQRGGDDKNRPMACEQRVSVT